jgi:CRP-like cAMP-binding protein
MATDYTSRLKTIALFASLKEAELDYVNSIVEPVKYSAGSVIFREGDKSTQFYLVETGQVCVLRRDVSGVEVVVRLLGPGQYFGEAGLVRNEPRNATVETTRDSTFFSIEEADFHAMVNRLPQVQKQLQAATKRRTGALERFGWQLNDEAVVVVAHRNVAPLIFESLDTLILWVVIPLVVLILSLLPWPRQLWALLPTTVLWMLRGGALLMAGGALALHVIDWTNDYLAVTNQRVVRVEHIGLRAEKRDEIPVDHIQNVLLTRHGLLPALFRLHTITVSTVTDKLVFTHTADAEHIQARILDQRSLAQQAAKRGEDETIRQELAQALNLSVPIPVESKLTLSNTQPAVILSQPEEATPQPSLLDRLLALRPKLQVRQEQSGQIIWHKHPILLIWRLVPPTLVCMVGIGVSFALGQLLPRFGPTSRLSPWTAILPGVLIVVVSVIMAWWEYVIWDQDLYILTSKTIVDIERRPLGLKASRRESNLDRIQDIDVDIPNIFGKILDMGNVHIKTGAAGSDLSFRSVSHPYEIQHDIFHRLAEVRRKEQEEERRQRFAEMSKWLSMYHDLTTQAQAEGKSE